MRFFLLVPLTLLLGCPQTPWCDRLNPEQPDDLRTCVFADTVPYDADITVTMEDGVPPSVSTRPRDTAPHRAAFRDGTRLTGQPWGVSWSVPAGDPDAEDLVDRLRTRSIREDSVGSVRTVALSPDESHYALGLRDGRLLVRTLDHETVVEARAASGTSPVGDRTEGNTFDAAAFSTDASVLALGDRLGTVEVWDVSKGTRRWQSSMDGAVRTVAVSPDGRLVAAGSSGGAVRVWDAASGRPVATWGHPTGIVEVGFSDDGTHVVARSAGRAYSESEVEQMAEAQGQPAPHTPGGLTGPDVVAVWRIP